MTIAERINLHRCGYSRAEIDALAKEEKEARVTEDQASTQDPAEDQAATDPAASQDPAPEPATDPAAFQDPAEDQASTQDPVLEAIKGLTAAIQASNINKTPQPEAHTETVSDLLKNL